MIQINEGQNTNHQRNKGKEIAKTYTKERNKENKEVERW